MRAGGLAIYVDADWVACIDDKYHTHDEWGLFKSREQPDRGTFVHRVRLDGSKRNLQGSNLSATIVWRDLYTISVSRRGTH